MTAVLEWILRLPLVWGGVACLAFYALLNQKIIDSPLLEQYCARHEIEIIEVSVFFVGMAALMMRLAGLVGQFSVFNRDVLEPITDEPQGVEACDRLLGQLEDLPARLRETYLVRRLADAISYVCRTKSADALDQHLRHLEEQESIQIQSGYSIVRIIVWAIPILGLLGTVIGITMAVANLNPQALEESTAKVTAGLGVAFDHTATALALTMILMFVKAGVERVEDRLLARVDTRVSAELVGRFQQTGAGQDPNVAAVRRMSQLVLEAIETLTTRQANVWKATFDESHQRWADVSVEAGRIVQDSLASTLKESLTTTLNDSIDRHAKVICDSAREHAERLNEGTAQYFERLDRAAGDTVGRMRDGLEKLAELLVESLQRHGEVMTRSEKELAEENRRHLAEVEAALGEAMVIAADRQEQLIKQSEHVLRELQVALVEAAGATVRHQEQLVKQSDVLLQVVDSTGQISKLENALNQNLATLRQGYHFEEMALNLSAAIQLLCARLGHLPTAAWAADTGDDDRASQAA
jgi:biopolymer transport protein ExbB/TolQ